VYLTYILKVFGVVDGGDELGFPVGASGGDTEATVAPLIDAIRDFRDEIRTHARGAKLTGILEKCDAFRDEAMVNVGVRLEDRADGTDVVHVA
jgi:cysteinyl-tRNA synthetase